MEQQSTQAREAAYQSLLDRIDKNSEGWDAVMEYRDTLYRRFFAAATTDYDHVIDQDDFIKTLDVMTLQLTAKFLPEIRVSYDECRQLILSGIAREWQKRTESVENNISLGTQALASVLHSTNASGFLDIPRSIESSE